MRKRRLALPALCFAVLIAGAVAVALYMRPDHERSAARERKVCEDARATVQPDLNAAAPDQPKASDLAEAVAADCEKQGR